MAGDYWYFSKVMEVCALGGAHVTSPLKTLDFLEAYPGILSQKFVGSCKADWLDSAGTKTLPSTGLLFLSLPQDAPGHRGEGVDTVLRLG